jgi:hypothetical protein
MATYRERNQGKAKLFIAREDRKRLAKEAKDDQPQTDPEDLPFEPLREKKQ